MKKPNASHMFKAALIAVAIWGVSGTRRWHILPARIWLGCGNAFRAIAGLELGRSERCISIV